MRSWGRAYAAVAVGLMGCDLPKETMTDSAGCQWEVEIMDFKTTRRIERGHPRLDSSGKPMCGKP